MGKKRDITPILITLRIELKTFSVEISTTITVKET